MSKAKVDMSLTGIKSRKLDVSEHDTEPKEVVDRARRELDDEVNTDAINTSSSEELYSVSDQEVVINTLDDIAAFTAEEALKHLEVEKKGWYQDRNLYFFENEDEAERTAEIASRISDEYFMTADKIRDALNGNLREEKVFEVDKELLLLESDKEKYHEAVSDAYNILMAYKEIEDRENAEEHLEVIE
ncbi:MAG: hypothetical protein H8Z69_00435 [Nanohaloarchaea archaeon]|nr:hypothetical protein [Candidatus Nanohaloarchaea archaeon]